ncbi:unnamed protein product [Amoebophrya sp. A25]|nr:unnamed protein product [Amoebophrya sp. A25]|eukprot:GSA25T00002269001.1
MKGVVSSVSLCTRLQPTSYCGAGRRANAGVRRKSHESCSSTIPLTDDAHFHREIKPDPHGHHRQLHMIALLQKHYGPFSTTNPVRAGKPTIQMPESCRRYFASHTLQSDMLPEIQEAQKFLEKGNWRKALGPIDRALDILKVPGLETDQIRALAWSAKANFELGNYSGALRSLQKGSELFSQMSGTVPGALTQEKECLDLLLVILVAEQGALGEITQSLFPEAVQRKEIESSAERTDESASALARFFPTLWVSENVAQIPEAEDSLLERLCVSVEADTDHGNKYPSTEVFVDLDKAALASAIGSSCTARNAEQNISAGGAARIKVDLASKFAKTLLKVCNEVKSSTTSEFKEALERQTCLLERLCAKQDFNSDTTVLDRIVREKVMPLAKLVSNVLEETSGTDGSRICISHHNRSILQCCRARLLAAAAHVLLCQQQIVSAEGLLRTARTALDTPPEESLSVRMLVWKKNVLESYTHTLSKWERRERDIEAIRSEVTKLEEKIRVETGVELDTGEYLVDDMTILVTSSCVLPATDIPWPFQT